MSIFYELLPKINGISKAFSEKFLEDLQDAFQKIDKFEEECKNARGKARDNNQICVMQSILEDEDCILKVTEEPVPRKLSNTDNEGKSSTESDPDQSNRTSKKRNKNEVDGIFSPEVEKRHKRSASVKAQSNIAKQVNVNLIQKLRRENSTEKKEKIQKSRNGKVKDKEEEDKENSEPVQLVQIKQEKISLPMDMIDVEVPPTMDPAIPIKVEQETTEDKVAMPPPTAPVPKPRKALRKNKSTEGEASVEETTKRSSTRTRRQKESITQPQPPPPAAPSGPSSRALRASNRVNRQTEQTEVSEDSAPTEPRPKRTRAKKKATETVNEEHVKESQSSQDSGIASPAEKPRPKRTRRAGKAAETKPEASEDIPIINATTTEETINEPQVKSPILQCSEKVMAKKKLIPDTEGAKAIEIEKIKEINGIISRDEDLALDQTRVIVSPKVLSQMDQTVVLPKPIYEHEQHTPKVINNVNETMVIRNCDETVVLDNANKIVMNSTVVIEKDPKYTNITDDNSMMTDDDSEPLTPPPKQNLPLVQPTSAVKEKVQQFEELASRVTRTKTRAMAKNEVQAQAENQTPPDRIVKQTLPMETLQKMNSLIFSGNPSLVTSANKPRLNGTNISKLPTSTSKLSFVKKTRDAVEETMQKEKEDARKKKEAILEAKKEQQRRKREEKMAAAAAAREAANKERQFAIEAAVKERMDRQAHAHLGKLERLKEAERKKQELARKVAETEERRKAEEQARQQRLAEEQKRSEALRKKQLEESEALKKEAAIMAKEIEKRQKEYKEKLKMKQKFGEATPVRAGCHTMEPVYMQDGFQYLKSDEEDSDNGVTPTPTWCLSKYRDRCLLVQSSVNPEHINRLFPMRVHTPDLTELFPGIDRSHLKRTSSAVWRTPPGHHHRDN